MNSRLAEFFQLAVRQLFRRKFRVILTVAGIAIGVAALVGTVALGEGIRTQAVDAIRTQSDLTLIEALRSGGKRPPARHPHAGGSRGQPAWGGGIGAGGEGDVCHQGPDVRPGNRSPG